MSPESQWGSQEVQQGPWVSVGPQRTRVQRSPREAAQGGVNGASVNLLFLRDLPFFAHLWMHLFC